MFSWLKSLWSTRSAEVTLGHPSGFAGLSLFTTTPTTAGVVVTKTNALNCMAYWSGIRLLSESLALLPLLLYRSRGSQKVPEEVIGHRTQLVVNRPNPTTTYFNFVRTAMHHVLTRGNAYMEIASDGAGRPAELWLADPDDMDPTWERNGRTISYRSRQNPDAKPLQQADVIHIPGLGFDGIRGYDVVTVAEDVIGLALGAEKYGARWFGSDGRPSGVLQNQGRLTQEALERQRKDWGRIHTPGSHEIAVLQEGTTFTPFDNDPSKSQALDVRRAQLLEICRLLRIPPHLLYDLERATYSNIEQQGLEYIMFSLAPWMALFEQEYTRKLLTEAEQQAGLYFRFDATELLRGDPHATASSESLLVNAGIKSPNEARAVLDLAPVALGDDLRTPLNAVALGAAPAGGDNKGGA